VVAYVENPVDAPGVHSADDHRGLVSFTVIASALVIVISAALTTLVLSGNAGILPEGVRAAVVACVAVILPGLPASALLRLPSNGVFGGVAIAVSIATNLLFAQANYALGLHHPFACQFVILGVATAFTVALAWRGHRDGHPVSLSAARAWLRNKLGPHGFRFPSLLLLVASSALFVSSVRRLNVDASGSYGLIQALPVEYFVGLALLSGALAIEYGHRILDKGRIATANVVLIVYVTMPIAWADRTAPFVTAYVHRSISDWMVSLGTLPPPVDARVNWAGFFSATANLTVVGGLTSSGIFAVSASLFFGVLIMCSLYAIGSAVTGNERIAWLGVTMFILFNWYQQDYFAPQAAALILYTSMLAVALWQYRNSAVPALPGGRIHRMLTAWLRTPGRVTGRSALWTLMVELTLIVLVAAVVISHQLTPLVTILVLAVFALLGLTRYKLLWLAAGLIFVAWFTYSAQPFWQGHLADVIGDVGGVKGNLDISVSERIAGDPIYSQMQLLRLIAAAILMGLAAVGWLRLRRDGSHLLFAVLGLAPFGLILVQSYGGEVGIRSFLYTSPVLCALAALALSPLLRPSVSGSRWRWPASAALTVIFLGLGVLVVTNRGLNASFERSTREEMAIANQVAQQIDTDQLGYWGQGSLYGIPKGFELKPRCVDSGRHIANCTALPGIKYVVVTRQDEQYLKYRYGVSEPIMQDALKVFTTELGFEVVYQSDQVTVMKRVGTPPLTVRWPQ
jgi:hypothetical protein